MSKKKLKIYDNQQQAANLVRNWRDNFIKEAGEIPPLLIIGGKVLYLSEILTNIAYAIESIPRPNSIIAKSLEK